METLQQPVDAAVADGTPIVVPISDQVSYQYFENNGKRSAEGLVSSGRWYPGLVIGHNFLFGLHQGDRFIPGIVWCGRFIPGLLSTHNFLPGVAFDNVFVPGVIASGAFIPGICKANNFVPGIVSENRLIPGFFMTDGKFTPGRFFHGKFETGVWKNGAFVASDEERIPTEDAHRLSREDLGLPGLKRFDAVGGLPLRGIIFGVLDDMLACVDHGLLTDEGVVLGGLWDKEDLVTVDPMLTLEKELGIDTTDQQLGTDKKYAKFTKMAEQFGQGISNPFFGVAGGFYGGDVNADANIADALNGLAAGSNALIDSLNQDYDDYWKSFDTDFTGMITEGGSWDKARQYGSGAGAVVGFLAGGIGGAGLGAAIGSAVVTAFQWIYEAIAGSDKPKDDKPQPGTSEPGDSGEENDEPFAYRPARGFMPIYIENHKQAIVTISDNQYSEYTGRTKQGAITFVATDTGPRAIINMSEVRRLGQMGGTKATVLGLNPLTGELMTFTGKPITPEEAQKRAVAKLVQNIIHKDPGHPIH